MFRDDVVFLIYLYQRWVYRVDKTRANEFGWVLGYRRGAVQVQGRGLPSVMVNRAEQRTRLCECTKSTVRRCMSTLHTDM